MAVVPVGDLEASAADRRDERRLLLLLGALAALAPVALDICFPALPALSEDFGVATSVAQLTMALFVVGIAIGQVFAGPLSDVYGRRRPLLVATAVYVVSSAACAIAPSIALLAGARLVQGFAASAGIAIGRAVVRDLHAGAAGASYLSRVVVIYGASPIVAPILGGQILRFADWRALYVAMVAFGAVVLLASLRGLPETLPPRRRARGSARATLSAFRWLVRDRAFVGYAAVLGLAMSAVFAYAGTAPFALQDVYGLSPQAYGVVFASSALAMVAGAQLNARAVGRYGPARLLALALVGAVVAGVGLLACALSDGPLWLTIVLVLGLMGAWGPTPANALALGMAEHPDRAGAAAALLGLTQYGVAAAVLPLVGLGGRGTLLPMAVAVTASSLLALAALTLTRPRPRLRSSASWPIPGRSR